MTTKTLGNVGTDTAPTVKSLIHRDIRTYKDWNEWLEHWNSATIIGEMLGILHAGFTVSSFHSPYGEKKYDYTDQLIVYFTIADGWTDPFDLLRKPNESYVSEYVVGQDDNGNLIYKAHYELRQMVAKKAFDMLALNFFKPWHLINLADRDRRRLWLELINDNRLFPVIMSFFRFEEISDEGQIRNLNSSRTHEWGHSEKIIVTFLSMLAEFLWSWEEGALIRDEDGRRRETATRTRIESAKLWMIEVLNHLDRLDLLVPRLLNFSKPSLAKLREIAMRSEIRDPSLNGFSDGRKVADLDEACYVGSPAALFLKRYELKKQVHGRFEAIRNAKKERDEAEDKLKKLSSPKP